MKGYLLAVGTALGTVGLANAQTVVADNDNSSTFETVSGFWSASSNPGFFGSTSLFAFVDSSDDRVRWTAPLPKPGVYRVSAWWVASSNRATDATYDIITRNGLIEAVVDQTTNGARWNDLGEFEFGTTSGIVELSNDATAGSAATFVSADAVQFEFVRDLPGGSGSCPTPVTPTTLETIGLGGNCAGRLLPGFLAPHPDTKYSIHSDLPEKFRSEGVLYTTAAVLPAASVDPIPLSLRTQTNAGFTTIDDDFDVFMFHISQPGDGSAPRRIAVYAENKGTEPVTIRSRQVIQTTGEVGNVHEMESTLGRRWMEEDFDAPVSQVTIQPGEGEVIGYSNNFAGFGSGIDANVNCFGLVRADITSDPADADLEVSVVAIPRVNASGIKAEVEDVLDVAATNDEDSINLNTAPAPSELRRAIGVFENFEWRSDVVTIDVAALSPSGEFFQMALSGIQAGTGCPEARQSTDMLLHPGFAHGDTIGNYHVDYRVDFRLVNNSTSNRAFDLRFGKSGADIGLGYQLVTGDAPADDETLRSQPVETRWAGPSQSDGQLSDSFLVDRDDRITIRPCEDVYVSIRLQVLGNSSLPFQIFVEPTTPEDLSPLVDDQWVVK